MSCFNKPEYKELKQAAEQEGVQFVSVTPDDLFYETPYNGITILFTKPRTGMRMINVAVSYCSPEDKFKPKHGKYQVLLKYFTGNLLALPLGDLSEDEIRQTLVGMFQV